MAENKQLAQKLEAIDLPTVEIAILELFNVINDQPIIEHIGKQFLAVHAARSRGEVAELSPIAQAAIIAIVDHLTTGNDYVYDATKASVWLRAANAGNN